jgi:hypothetical protein
MEREASIDKFCYLMFFMYIKNAELVVNYSKKKVYLFYERLSYKDLFISNDEISFLSSINIIEPFSGCEEGESRIVYILSDNAKNRIKQIIQQKKR